MKALGLWLLVVRLAIVTVFALQCSSSGASAPRLSNGGSHAAVGVKASCVSACDHESHQTNLFDSGAHGGHIKNSDTAERSLRAQDIGVPALKRSGTSELPPARAWGARARDIEAIMRARVRDVGRPVVRLTGGCTLVAEQSAHLSEVQARSPGVRAAEECRCRGTSHELQTWPAGETASGAEAVRAWSPGAVLTEGSRPSRSAAKRLAMVRGETPRRRRIVGHETAKLFASARGYTCGKVAVLFRALAMLASEARDKVVRIDTRALTGGES